MLASGEDDMSASNDMPRIASTIYLAGYDDRVKFTPEQRERMRLGKSPYLRDRKIERYEVHKGKFV